MAKKTRFLLPDLWADHHVIKVRKLLVDTPGVVDVYASSAFKEVAIEYDPGKVDPSTLAKLLADAGYPPSDRVIPDDGAVVYGEADSMWRERGSRVTETDQRDIEMSGDFRRY